MCFAAVRLIVPTMACLVWLGLMRPLQAADDVSITPDVVYGHKHGLAMTFDVFQPKFTLPVPSAPRPSWTVAGWGSRC